jgi:hypothetical protein
VDHGKGALQTVGDRGGALGAAGVRRHNDAVAGLEVLPDPLEHRGLAVEVVDRHVEEALDL